MEELVKSSVKRIILLNFLIAVLLVSPCCTRNDEKEQSSATHNSSHKDPGGKGSTAESMAFKFHSIWQGETTNDISISKESDGWYLSIEALADDNEGAFTKGDILIAVIYREEILAIARSLAEGETVKIYYFNADSSTKLYDIYCIEIVI